MPANNIILTAFAGTYVGLVGGKAVVNWLSGLKVWHEYCGAPWHGNDAWVHMARVTANKEGTVFKRKPRDPICHKVLNIDVYQRRTRRAVTKTKLRGARLNSNRNSNDLVPMTS